MDATLSSVSRILVGYKLISRALALESDRRALQENLPVVSYLVKNKLLDSTQLALKLAKRMGCPYLDLYSLDLTIIPTDVVSESLIRRHRLLPLSIRHHQLQLATSDPTNISAFDDIGFHTGKRNDIIVVEDDKLTRVLEQFLQLGVNTSNRQALADINLDHLTEVTVEAGNLPDESDINEDAPIIRYVNQLLEEAIRSRASDIHLEPYEKSFRIRLRIDGVLTELASPPVQIAGRIAARLKIMAKLDIAERRLPQDGRIKLKFSRQRAMDFRVNTLPTLWGEKIVLRNLDSGHALMGMDKLGFSETQQQLYTSALERSQGLILVTGPTGSGKTVTLYSGLASLNTPQRNISTAEDPVEINLEGINQVQVNQRTGLDFARALRAFLRQDPDVIMVGEIRDRETAEIAIKAAHTGHLVLSTLHTNSAVETLTRLRNMGIPAYNLASSVTLIIAQRLARKLCEYCRRPMLVPPALAGEAGIDESPGTMKVFAAVGCQKCSGGYRGRIGIYEVVPIIEPMSRIIMAEADSIQIAEQVQKQGIRNLRQAALYMVSRGLTSLEEANRVT